MQVKKIIFLGAILATFVNPIFSQIVINEIQTSNCETLPDEDKDYPDWVELYNTSDEAIDLSSYSLSDRVTESQKWTFPSIPVKGKGHFLVFASGKDRKDLPLNWQTVVDYGDNWRYSTEYKAGWRGLEYDDNAWKSGPSGFGFGDNDDATIIPQGTLNLYIRTKFQIENPDEIQKIAIHVDYDDAFIAFINGKEVARENIAICDADYSNVTTATYTEPILCNSGTLTTHMIEVKPGMLQKGENVFAVQGHNCNSTSSDFTLIPILSLASESYIQTQISKYITLSASNFHTNFKISSEGESVYLFKNSVLIDSIPDISIPIDKSYGRITDGASSMGYFIEPTPNAPNEDAVENLPCDSIKFSTRQGFFSKAFALVLYYAEPDCEIRYTTDCTNPTSKSLLYQSAFLINKTTIIRAAAFKDGKQISGISTKSYIFRTDHELPVVSITSEPKNFFDYNEGIFELGPNASSESPNYGANFWNDWEKPIYFEYFDTLGNCPVHQSAGVKITGAYSRANSQKSMAIFARKKYGKNSFDYKFFQDRPTTSFKSFTLRNSGNDIQYTMFRDGLVSETAKNMDIDRLAFQPTVVYINGVYWGILNMREKPNEHYFVNNYGADPDSVNIAEGNGYTVMGSTSSYNQLTASLNSKTTVNDQDYASISEVIDIDCFIDYELLEIYINNGDWPGNNIKYWMTSFPNNKWRWILYDTDYGMGLYDINRYMDRTMVYATTTTGPDWPNPAWSTLLLRKLLTNTTFKNKFINRFADCMNTNLEKDSVFVTIDSLKEQIDHEMTEHVAKWWTWRNYDTWVRDVNDVKKFFQNRPSYMRSDMASFFKITQNRLTVQSNDEQAGHVNLNTIKLHKFPFTGIYFSQVPIDMTAIPAPGYRFVCWEGGVSSNDPHCTLNLQKAMTVKAVFEPIPESEKETPNIVINEICFNSENPYKSGDWIELYNSGTQSVDMSGWRIEDAKASDGFTLPEGTVIEPKGFLVVSCSLLEFKRSYPKKAMIGEAAFGLSSTRDMIYLYNADSVEVDYVFYEPLAPWPDLSTIDGATLELTNPQLDNNNGANWKFGIKGGTPGIKNSSLVSSEKEILNDFSAFCYPTFFDQSTTLNFGTTKSGKFSVEVVDINGSVLQVINADNLDAVSEIELFNEEGRSFASGLYFVRLISEEGTQVMKVIKKAK